MAILQTGNNPLWFSLTEKGPVQIESVEDAANIEALIPWPYAYHARFILEAEDGIIIAVNRDGFLKLASNTVRERGIALYRFSDSDFWSRYTVGGLVYYRGYPVSLLYLDERFLDTDDSHPWPRTWSFDMNSNELFTFEIPTLQNFAHEEGWDIDTLRLANDGFYYYRARNRNQPQTQARMFRVRDLNQKGDEIPIDTFHQSSPRETRLTHPSLPELPLGFVYTNIAAIGNSLFASWEEQEDYSIGAAGFVVIRNR